MQSNPYAPPKAQVADIESSGHGLRHRSVLVMIFFTLISLGLYYLIWWFRRRPGLNRLDSPRKLPLWPLLAMAALFVAQFVVGLLEGLAPAGEPATDVSDMVMALAQLFVGISMLLQTFNVKGMIEDHAAPDRSSTPLAAEDVKLSGIMTFFFSIFYLQWAINKYVVDRGASPS